MKLTFSHSDNSSTGVIKWLRVGVLAMMMTGSLLLPLQALADDATPSDCGDFKVQGPLCLPQSPFANNNGLVSSTSATDLVSRVINLALYFSGIVAVVFVIIGGFYYMTARGNEEQATSGRHTLIYAIIGLVIVIFSFVIVNVITTQLTKGNT